MPLRLLFVGLAAYVFSAFLFLTLDVRADWGFILAFRGPKLVALTVVAVAVAVSTLVFQTITANRILTPAILGFDALYVLIQTVLVLFIGGAGRSGLHGLPLFTLEAGLMVVLALLLFHALLRRSHDLNRLVLTGIVLGILLRSISSLISRLIDPSEYAFVMANSYAGFNNVDLDLLWIACGVTATLVLVIWFRSRQLDVVALGADTSRVLGVEHRLEARRLMTAVSLLVAVSTALVGPIVFFGLLVCAITYLLAGTWRHAILLPLSALFGASLLITCQTLFERVLNLQSNVLVVIDGAGGLIFLYLLYLGSRR